MTEDLYRLALQMIERHLDAARIAYSLEDGDLCFRGHRLGLSIGFDGFATQGQHLMAPVEIQLHVDGDDGTRFRVGVLGTGLTEADALKAALEEWHLLVAAAVLAALGAPVGSLKRDHGPQKLADWSFFPGRAGLRGVLPPGLATGGTFYRLLMNEIRKFVSQWPEPHEFSLRSIFLLYSSHDGTSELQAAVDGLIDKPLTESLSKLEWPVSPEAYLYKQLLVFRGGQGMSRPIS